MMLGWCPFVVLASNFRSDLRTNVEVLGIILEGFGPCVHGFFVDFVSILFRLLHRFLILSSSLDGGFFDGFRFDFLFIFESKLKGVGFIWGGWSRLLASLFGLRIIIFGIRGIILRGFWHHFSVLGRSLGSRGGSLGSQG